MSFPSYPSRPRSSCCCIATTTCNLSRGSRNCQWSWAHLWDELLLETLPMLLEFGVPLPPPFPKKRKFRCLAFVSLMTVGSARTQTFLGIAPKSPPRAVGNVCPPFLWKLWISPIFFVEGYHFETHLQAAGSVFNISLLQSPPFSEEIHCQGCAKASQNLQKESMSRPEALQRPEPSKKTVGPPNQSLIFRYLTHPP